MKIKNKNLDDFIISVIIYYCLVNKFEDMDINLYCLFDFNLKKKQNIINIVNNITVSNTKYASIIRRFSLGFCDKLEFFEIL